MTTIPSMTITPAGVADTYARIDRGEAGGATSGFGSALQRALEGAVRTGQQAEEKAVQAISGTGSLTEVVTALSQAELTLQTATTVRDRVIQAYQDIIRMPI
jgi:flagellar hook-basal body complex protein FliE